MELWVRVCLHYEFVSDKKLGTGDFGRFEKKASDVGLIHRDLKGDNIFVGLPNSTDVVIFDYGLNVAAGKPDGKSPGCMVYEAPEMFYGEEQSFKTDVFLSAQGIYLYCGA